MPNRHLIHSSMIFEEDLVAISGIHGESVDRYSFPRGSWESIASLPEKRSDFAAAVVGDAIYIVGGF